MLSWPPFLRSVWQWVSWPGVRRKESRRPRATSRGMLFSRPDGLRKATSAGVRSKPVLQRRVSASNVAQPEAGQQLLGGGLSAKAVLHTRRPPPADDGPGAQRSRRNTADDIERACSDGAPGPPGRPPTVRRLHSREKNAPAGMPLSARLLQGKPRAAGESPCTLTGQLERAGSAGAGSSFRRRFPFSNAPRALCSEAARSPDRSAQVACREILAPHSRPLEQGCENELLRDERMKSISSDTRELSGCADAADGLRRDLEAVDLTRLKSTRACARSDGAGEETFDDMAVERVEVGFVAAVLDGGGGESFIQGRENTPGESSGVNCHDAPLGADGRDESGRDEGERNSKQASPCEQTPFPRGHSRQGQGMPAPEVVDAVRNAKVRQPEGVGNAVRRAKALGAAVSRLKMPPPRLALPFLPGTHMGQEVQRPTGGTEG